VNNQIGGELMDLVVKASKRSYDRPITMELDAEFENQIQSGEYLKKLLTQWIMNKTEDDIELLEKLEYDYPAYRTALRMRVQVEISKAINDGYSHIKYNDYDSFNFSADIIGNLTMITKGCPSDNSYMGETYQVIRS
jgi:hypothetical protein